MTWKNYTPKYTHMDIEEYPQIWQLFQMTCLINWKKNTICLWGMLAGQMTFQMSF